jgi:regulator of sigma E protease
VSYFLAFAGFAALIILHEFGHFAAAKLTGMRVERFALFFPPLIAKVRKGETEYGIGAIPLGGYVKITGMNPQEELPPEVAARSYYRQPVWKRVVVILAGPAMNVLVAFLLLFGLAFGALKPTSKVEKIVPGTPAERVLEPGDRILSVDGHSGDQVALRNAISRHRCAGQQGEGCLAATPAIVRIERNGRILTVRVRPRYDAAQKRTLIGFQFGATPIHPSVFGATRIAGDLMWFVTSETTKTIVQVFKPEKRKEVGSVVGGYEVTQQGFAQDARRALTILAVISLSLALINLFPFLPLDGGHVFWSLVEKVRGKPVPFRIMEQASVVGFMLVILLFFIGLTNDIDRLSGGGFSNR